MPTETSTLAPNPAIDKRRSPVNEQGNTAYVPTKLHLDRRAGQLAQLGAGNADDLLSPTQLAQWLGVNRNWLTTARMGNYGPPYIQEGPKYIRYRRDAVLAWLKSREITSTAEAKALLAQDKRARKEAAKTKDRAANGTMSRARFTRGAP